MSTAAVLRETLEIVLASDDTFPARFYELLFEQRPELRALFTSSSPNVQRLKFAQSMAWIVDHVEDGVALESRLHEIADAHVGYGVTDEMYPVVGRALLDTLREALGSAFSPDVEAAWRGAYDQISSVMRARAATVRAS